MSLERPAGETPDEHDRHVDEGVDEALEETFPASDPPSFIAGRERTPENEEST